MVIALILWHPQKHVPGWLYIDKHGKLYLTMKTFISWVILVCFIFTGVAGPYQAHA